MACRLHLLVHDAAGPGQIAEAIALLERLEARWSRFLPDSDLTRLNDGAGLPVAVAPETVTLVEAMGEAWSSTQGRYDPTILPLLVGAGYGTSRIDPTRTTVLPTAARHTGAMDAVVVDRAASTVTVPVGTALDPGGIGKGLAADLAVAFLLSGGAAGALVSIGGDLAAAGTPPEPEGWRVDIERADPTDRPLCRAAFDHGGVATSSTRSRRWTVDGRPRHHALDPATGAPSETDLAAVTVFATSGREAEAFATSALLAGRDAVVAHLDSHGLSGLAIADDGAVLRTADLADLQILSSEARS